MYRLPRPEAQVLSSFCQNMANTLWPVISSFLNGETFQFPVRNRRKFEFGLGVNTLTRKFLSQLLLDDKLEQYLSLSYRQQKKLIAQLAQSAYPDDLIFKQLGACIYDTYFDGTQEPYDDFNEI